MCPFGRRLVNGEGSLLAFGSMVCHCLLVETDDGLVLVDTGFGTADLREFSRRFPLWFRVVCLPRLDAREPAIRQVERLGYSPADVRHIVPTHMDLDHVGGLADFPDARVHVHQPEYDAAMRRMSASEKSRYLPVHWAHQPKWEIVGSGGDDWFGFQSVRVIGDRVALIPLYGHTRGHCGVAVRRDDGRWLLHAGDAYFFHREVHADPWCPLGLRVFQRAAALDNTSRLRNVARLRDLHAAHGDEVDIFCAHSPDDFARLSAG
ncbi:MAG: MBL fold metallo-hydrolase [Armatimonadetes bacterium]|nr:MBL fold metallo-hydrolase [Armatimonadota bacterium]